VTATILIRLRTALADRYRVDSELGAGGMATVYLAHDLRHERDVAIKVLHPDLGAALGGERFLSEIRTTARLQHPHILPLLDSGSADSLLYYVMPLVTGDTLRTRLERERQLPVEEAVRIAREVASALEHAHKQGVIHRDIKPENILLQDGSALVADFGIALAVQQAGGQRLTQTGLSLGTPQYMSPEQATGERTIDARSDLYALGAITYEMLAGEPPFTGPSTQAIVARLMTEEPRGLVAQRKAVPPGIEAAVLKALEKLPADRFASAGEFAAALDARTMTSARTASTAAVSPRRSRLVVVTSVLAVAGFGTAAWSLTRPSATPDVLRYRLVADSVSAERTWTGDVNISPDGRVILRRGGPGERILLRRRDALDFVALAGSEGAMGPTFSPDGSRLVFYQEGRLVIMPAAGGPPTVIADSMLAPEAVAWGANDVIYRGSDVGPLVIGQCSPRDCRKPAPFTVLDSAHGEVSHMLPDVSADGRLVLFQAERANGTRTIEVQATDARTHATLMDGVRAKFAPGGRIIYSTSDGKLWVVGFDAGARALRGEPALVAENLPLSIVGVTDFAVSASGTLVYGEERGTGLRELVWVTRDGAQTPVDPAWRAGFSSPVVSRDGQRIAVTVRDAGKGAIWLREARGAPSRLTSGQNASEPAWSPDGRTISFLVNGGSSNTGDVWRQPADGSDVARRFVRSDRPLSEQVWLTDGTGLIVRTTTPAGGHGDLLMTRAITDSVAQPLLATERSEYSPAVSPDGQWLAYASNISGRFEIYVAPRTAPDRARVVSTGGASSPRWSADGTSLYYLSNTSRLMEARVSTTPALRVDGTRVLFDATPFVQTSLSRRNYDVAPDGRFLFVRRADDARAGAMVVVEQWTRELDAKR
jgi:serine/threonine-protein kinase